MKTQQKEFPASGTKTIYSNIKKCAVLFSACLFSAGSMFSQTTYDNFEGNKLLYYSAKTGVLDTMAANPAPNKINKNEKCAKYVRSGEQKFDYIKMNLLGKLTDIPKYATYTGTPPVITMKIYTTAPVGTLIDLQLAKAGKNEYPAGVNSQYLGKTTVTNAWETVKFKFSQTPKGSETTVNQVDQIIVLFNPNSSTKDTYYFSDITGPTLAPEKAKLSTSPPTVIKGAIK